MIAFRIENSDLQKQFSNYFYLFGENWIWDYSINNYNTTQKYPLE